MTAGSKSTAYVQARAFCQALHAETARHSLRWRSITQIANHAGVADPGPALAVAVKNGWLEVLADRSVILTERGLKREWLKAAKLDEADPW